MTAPIIVLGMHRSGTSCLAGLLQEAGVWFGKVSRKSLNNDRGSREHAKIVDLNDAVLAISDGAWDDPPSVMGWSGYQLLDRTRILQRLQRKAKGGPWGFKDPRTLLTLPFWGDGRYIGTFRHPHAVAASLYVSQRTPSDVSYRLWERYNRNLLDLHAAHGFPIVSFDQQEDEYLASVQRAFAEMDLPQATELFFWDDMRHWSAPYPKLDQPCRDIYEELLACSA